MEATVEPRRLLSVPYSGEEDVALGGDTGPGDGATSYWRRPSYPHVDAADEYYSLEPEMLQVGGHGTVMSSVWNVCNTILGAGTLTYPYSFMHAGWALGIVLLLFVALLTWYSFRILTKCAALTGEYSYNQLGTKAYGPKMGIFSLLIIVFAAFGSMIAYNVLISDFAIPLLTLVFDNNPPSWIVHKSFVIGVVSAFILLPLSLLKDLHRLRHTSLVAICAIAYTVIALTVRFVQRGQAIDRADVVATDPKILLSIPLITMSFGGQVNMLRIYQELRWNLKSAMPKIINWSTGICCLVYCSMGVVGALMFGRDTVSNVLKNFGTDDFVITIARIGFLFAIMFSFPLVHFAFRMTLYELIYVGKVPPLHHLAITTVNIAVSAVIAILAPSIGVVFGFTGSIIGSSLIFILPGLFHLRLASGDMWSRHQLPSLGLVIVGVVFGLCGFTVVLINTVT